MFAWTRTFFFPSFPRRGSPIRSIKNRHISLIAAAFRTSLTLTLVLSLAVSAQRLWAADPPPAERSAAKTVSVLSVGNSFSRNATRFLDDLATAANQQWIHAPIYVGGASLELHANKAAAYQRDADDEQGHYTNGKSLTQMLQERRWDVVTLQQASIKSHDPSTYQPHADELAGLIRQHAPQAQLLMYQTWAYRVDDPRFAQTSAEPGEPTTRDAMYQGLRDAYRHVAAQLNVEIIPVGDAFNLADTDPRWGYRPDQAFDFKTAQPPALPRQAHSLHVGWRWREQPMKPATLSYDGHHANTAGEYLGACVWYEVLFDQSVVGNPFVPAELDPAHASFLQHVAHRAVAAR